MHTLLLSLFLACFYVTAAEHLASDCYQQWQDTTGGDIVPARPSVFVFLDMTTIYFLQV